MKKEGIEVLDLDVKKLIEMLNAALSEEWLAYYQYWVGAQIMEGPMRAEVETEFLKHANEEKGHADLVIERINKLNGTPVLNPNEWTKLARCKYEEPKDPYIETVLEQNLRGERCAIARYQEIAEFARKGNDFATEQMAIRILQDELEHENDIIDFQTDINEMKKNIVRMMK